MKGLFSFLVLLLLSLSGVGQDLTYTLQTDVAYYNNDSIEADAYIAERCKLDIYYPADSLNFATIVWFHGGGLSAGEKAIPEVLKEKGLAVVAVNYRLHPRVKAPVYIQDAAASVAWAIKNIAKYGGDSSLVFVSGHSAGGYLTTLVGLDKKWLEIFHVDANALAGLIPFSGHAITHFTIRKERGLEWWQPVVDEMAPLYHVRDDAPPLLLITGDRELELWGRYEENAYLARMMKLVGHSDTRLFELDGYGHGMEYPAFPLLLEEVTRITKQKRAN